MRIRLLKEKNEIIKYEQIVDNIKPYLIRKWGKMQNNSVCARCDKSYRSSFWGPAREAKTMEGDLFTFCSGVCRKNFLIQNNAKIYCHKP